MSDDARIAAALIALIGVAVGVLISKVLELVLENRRRRRRTLDIIIALQAEIEAGRQIAGVQLTPHEREYAIENMSPFAAPDRTDFVFEAVKADLSILPAELIRCVVLYYRLAEQSNILTEHLLHEAFERQTEEEKRQFKEGLLNKIASQERAATAALDKIERYLADRQVSGSGEGQRIKQSG